jgi:DNA-binding LytR/AlgR family response regulator
MKIRCIIVDDEPLARQGMQMLIADVPELELVGEFQNAIEAGQFLNAHPNIDLMFLDVDMPGLTGLDFLRILPNKPLTILTTAYANYALTAYELDVVNYLLKPIEKERFKQAIDKTIDLIHLLQKGPETGSKPASPDFIFFKSERKFIKVFYNDLIFVKAMKDYVIIYTTSTKHITAMNIKVLQEQLPEDKFVRVSKSHVINLDFILAIDIDGITLKGMEQEVIPLGETYRDDFINNYVRNSLVHRK